MFCGVSFCVLFRALTSISTVIFGTIFSILFESVVIALTWAKTADIQRMLRVANPNGPRQGLSYLILRDGMTFNAVTEHQLHLHGAHFTNRNDILRVSSPVIKSSRLWRFRLALCFYWTCLAWCPYVSRYVNPIPLRLWPNSDVYETRLSTTCLHWSIRAYLVHSR